MKVAVRLVARGEYPSELPETLANSLAEAVRQHMFAYGIKNVAVDIDLGIAAERRSEL